MSANLKSEDPLQHFGCRGGGLQKCVDVPAGRQIYDNLLKIHPIYLNWAPLSAIKTPQLQYQSL